ncbi:hypothetical protein MMC25_001789 [Agyrium rufum]|nr:hypothetical protein [Agyrium rufum]
MSSAKTRRQGGLESSMDDLILDTSTTASSKPTKAPRPIQSKIVIESWEDEASSDDDDDEGSNDADGAPTRKNDARPITPLDAPSHLPSAPPPTPISPSYVSGRAAMSNNIDDHYSILPQSSSSPRSSSMGVRPSTSLSPTNRPTPSATRTRDPPPLSISSSPQSSHGRDGGDGGVRPEKTMATASRLIAGALGVRAPKKNEEQKRYEDAVREKERRRIGEEREAKRRAEEEKERAKAAVWDD